MNNKRIANTVVRITDGYPCRVWAGWMCFYLLITNFTILSECQAKVHRDVLDPVDIFVSTTAEEANEPNTPRIEMKVTDVRPLTRQFRHLFPLDFTATFQPETEPDTMFISKSPQFKEPTQQLMKASISILNNDNDTAIKTDLEHLIEKINRIEIETQNTETDTKSSGTTVGIQQKTPKTKKQKPLKSQISKTPEEETELPYVPISKQTLKEFDRLTQHPENVDNPFELAELLFLSKQLEKAAVFYDEALSRTSNDSSISTQRKAWILFQLGNCLQKSDPDRAKQCYTQLINKFPKSSWIEPAKSQLELVNWFQTDQPETLFSDNQF